MEQKFKDLNDANDRLSTWIDQRDSNFMNQINENQQSKGKVDNSDGSVTYTLGALKLRGKVSQLNKQQLMIEMIEDEFILKEPKNFLKYMLGFWVAVGAFVNYNSF